MPIDDRDISSDFTALAQLWTDRQTIFLIDGSGSMQYAYAGQNAIGVTVGYATQLRNTLDPSAKAYFFGEQEEYLRPIPLNGDDPMRRCPGGGGYLMPTLGVIARAYDEGKIAPKLHLVIVSDGEISDGDGGLQVKQTLEKMITDNPDIIVDAIVPSKGNYQTQFAKIVSEVMQGDPRAPGLHVVTTSEQLTGTIEKFIMQGRVNLQNAVEDIQKATDSLVESALEGVQQPVRVLPSLKFKKNGIE